MKRKYLALISIAFISFFIPLVAYAVNTLIITGSISANIVTIDKPEITITDNGTNLVSDLDLYGNGILLQSFTFDPVVNVPTGVPTTLNHTFGQTITISTDFYENATVTSSGNTISFTHDNENQTANGLQGILWAEKFTGLPVGEDISSVSLNVTNAAGNVRVKIYNSSESSNGNITNNYINSTFNYATGTIFAEKFSGLPVGGNITAVWLNFSATGGAVRVKVYQDDGSADTGYIENDCNTPIGPIFGALSSVYSQRLAIKVLSGYTFLIGEPVSKVSLHVHKAGLPTGDVTVGIRDSNDVLQTSTTVDASTFPNNGGSFPAAAGWMVFNFTSRVIESGDRITMEYNGGDGTNYVDWCGATGGIQNIEISEYESGAWTNFDTQIPSASIITGYRTDYPSTLLFSGDNSGISGMGAQKYSANATIPVSGSIWAAFEGSDSPVVIASINQAMGVAFAQNHVYGTGPDPFGPPVLLYDDVPWMMISYTPTNDIEPSTLLGESSSIAVSGTGIVTFPVSATIPVSGNVYAAFEADSSSLELRYSAFQTWGSVKTNPHTYGTGPDPFGSVNYGSYPMWMSVDIGGVKTVSQVKSNTLSFSPAYIPTYITNCGLSHCASKLVNYTVSRSLNYSKLTLTVNVIPIPFDIECLMTNGTFTQTSAWHNFTSINALNLTVNVIPNDNAYGICYGSGELLSFRSAGNQSDIVTGANVLSGSFGTMLGVPIGTFVVVMIGSLASQRTAPIYVVIVLAVIGIMSAISFFTLESGIWAMVLIAGMLGLFVGRKVF